MDYLELVNGNGISGEKTGKMTTPVNSKRKGSIDQVENNIPSLLKSLSNQENKSIFILGVTII